MVSPRTSTSARWDPVAVTRVPPVTTMDTLPPSRKSGLGQGAVGVGTAVAVEGPPVADLGEQSQVEIADHQLGLVGVGRLADELALRVDEVGGAVEVVL